MPGNIIPADRFDAVGQALLRQFPDPNFTDRGVSLGQYNYRDQDIRDVTKRLDQLKVDFNATTKDRLTVRWRDWYPLTIGYGGTFGSGGNWNFHRQGYTKSEKSLQTTYSRTFGVNLVNEASASFRVMRETAPNSEDDRHLMSASGIPPFQLFPSANVLGIVPAVSYPGVPTGATITYDTRYPIAARDGRYSIVDTLSWSKGSHLFKAGLLYEFNPTSEGPQGTCFQGCFNFSSQTAVNINPLNTNYAFANALLGYYNQYQETNLKTEQKAQASIWEWFVQDTWKPIRNLTLDLGVRFGHVGPYRLPDGLIGAAFVPDRWNAALAPRLFAPAIVNGTRVGFDQVTGQVVASTLIGFLVPGSGDAANGMVTDKGPLPAGGLTFMPSKPRAVITSPRFGFAYDLGGAGKTAIRGSFSVLQDLLPASSDLGRNVPGFAPYSRVSTFLYGRIPDLAGTAAFDSPINPVAFDDYEPQTAYTYSLEMQQNLGGATTLSVAYVGNRYLNLRNNLNINPIAPGARFDPANADPTNPASPLPDNFLRPMIGYGAINMRTNDGYSRYNSLQVTANRRVPLRPGVRVGLHAGRGEEHERHSELSRSRLHLRLRGRRSAARAVDQRRLRHSFLDRGAGCGPRRARPLAGRRRRRLHHRRAGDRDLHHDRQLRLHRRRRRRTDQHQARMRSDSSQRRALAPALVRHVLLHSPVGPGRRGQFQPHSLLRPGLEHVGPDPDEGRQGWRLA